MLSGTGSLPPFAFGLHLNNRFANKKLPFISPNLFIAITPYVEHVGVNLQDFGRIGEIKILYK